MSAAKRAAGNHEHAIHGMQIACFTQLLIDLKKRELGHAYRPITIARLEECSRHVQTLFQCKKKMLFKRQ